MHTEKSNWRNVNRIRGPRVATNLWFLTGLCAAFAWATDGFAQSSAVAGQVSRELVKEPIRGIIRAVETAMISTEFALRISKVAFREGERFKKGDVLIEFDCRRPRAELAAAEAQLHEMQLTLDNNHRLQRAQAVGRHDLEVSLSRVTKAAAEAEALRVRLDQCHVVAPYDGRVLELSLHALETPQPGKPFIGIVAEQNLEIELVVPSIWVRWIAVEAALTFMVDETGAVHKARVKRIGASVDPISQTIKIVAAFDHAIPSILSGMSGTAEFSGTGG